MLSDEDADWTVEIPNTQLSLLPSRLTCHLR